MRSNPNRLTVWLLCMAALLLGTNAFAQVLVQKQHLVYEGAFRLPGHSGPGGVTGDANSFNGGGEALTFDPATGTLLLTGSRCCDTTVAEISIPEVRNVPTIAQLATATYVRPHTDVLGGTLNAKGCGGPAGGLLAWAGNLIVSAYCYYDAGYVQTKSHWRTARNFSNAGLVGPVEVQSPTSGGGRAGFVSGYMTTIPAEWQGALGGPALTGNCCIPIITRTSWGPAVSVFNPGDVGVREPVPAVNVLGYPNGHPLDGDANCDATSTLFNCNTGIGGLIFPGGTASVLFFGTQGLGEHCYGRGTTDPAMHRQPDPASGPNEMWCYDPAAGSKGGHAFPYAHYVWAYDANDFVKVKNGQLLNWQVRPYATWSFDTPFPHIRKGIGGVAFDPVSKRVYVSMSEQDAPRPLIQVFRLQTGSTTPVPTDTIPPTVNLTAPANGSTVSGAITVSAAASDNVAVAGVRFEVDGLPIGGGEDLTAPYSVTWTTTGLGNGSHAIRAIARDTAGLVTTSAAITANVQNTAPTPPGPTPPAPGSDTTLPTVVFERPADKATTSTGTWIVVKARDNVGVAGVKFFVNEVLVEDDTIPDPGDPAMYDSVRNLPTTPTVIRAEARDAAGNTASACRYVNGAVPGSSCGSGTPPPPPPPPPADTTAPMATVTAPGAGMTVQNTFLVTAAATDNVGVVSVQFTLDGANLGAADTTAPFEVAWDTTTATAGAHTLRAIARDAVGNTGTSPAVSVTVNNAPPPPVTAPAPVVAAGEAACTNRAITLTAPAGSNWRGQLRVNGANVGSNSTSLSRTFTFAKGDHTLDVVWTRSGSAAVTSALGTFRCQ